MSKKNNRTLLIILVIVALVVAVPTVVYGYNTYNYNKYYNLALENLKEDRYEEAISQFNKALEFKKDKNEEINTQVNLIEKLKQSKADYEQGETFSNDKRYTEAISSFQKVIKEDEKRYGMAQEKINESKGLFISENISKAKEQANNKSYEEAIKYLDIIINFEPSNSEALELKNQYTAEIEKVKLEAAKKEAEEKAKEEAAKKVQNNTIPSTKPSAPSTSDGKTFTVSKGSFMIYDSNGNKETLFGFGPPGFQVQPYGIIYQVMGNEQDFEITFYLKGREARNSGKTKTGFFFMPAMPEEVPKNENIKITLTMWYKGKKYSDTFYYIINNLNL